MDFDGFPNGFDEFRWILIEIRWILIEIRWILMDYDGLKDPTNKYRKNEQKWA